MLDHDEALDLAASQLDRELDADGATALTEHLAGCRSCASAVAAMHYDAHALAGMPRRDAPERIRHAVVTSAVEGSAPQWRAGRAAGAAAVSLLAVGVAGAVLLAASGRTPNTVQLAPPAYAWSEEPLTSGSGSSVALTAMADRGGTVVAIGAGPAGSGAWRSVAGSSWASVPATAFWGARVTGAIGTPDGFVAVGFAVGPDGASRAVSWVSRDGTSWIRSPDSQPLSGAAMTDVVTAGGGLLAVGLRDQPESAAIWTSTDGLHWQSAPQPTGADGARVNSVTEGPRGLVAVGQDAAGAAVWTSTDGRTFTRQTLPVALSQGTRLMAITSGGPGYVAVGSTVDASQQQGGALWTSSDGRGWTSVADPTDVQGVDLVSVAAGGGRLIAVGAAPAGAVAFSSTDGLIWQALPAGPGFSGAVLRSVVLDGPDLLIVGSGKHGPESWRLSDPALPGGG
jgi:Putative zinc-finger